MFTRSPITDALVRYLQPFDKGTSITYAELSTAAACKITSMSYHLRRVRVILQNEHGQVWEAVTPHVGLYRLTDKEIAQRQGKWWLPGARRKLVRGSKQAAIVELGQLTIDEQARFATHNIQSELAQQALSKATATRIGKVARGTSNDLPAFNAIEWAITLMRPRFKPEEKKP